jgi:hypothetical protein
LLFVYKHLRCETDPDQRCRAARWRRPFVKRSNAGLIWPGFTWLFRRRTRRFDPADYDLRQRVPSERRGRAQSGRPTAAAV